MYSRRFQLQNNQRNKIEAKKRYFHIVENFLFWQIVMEMPISCALLVRVKIKSLSLEINLTICSQRLKCFALDWIIPALLSKGKHLGTVQNHHTRMSIATPLTVVTSPSAGVRAIKASTDHPQKWLFQSWKIIILLCIHSQWIFTMV